MSLQIYVARETCHWTFMSLEKRVAGDSYVAKDWFMSLEIGVVRDLHNTLDLDFTTASQPIRARSLAWLDAPWACVALWNYPVSPPYSSWKTLLFINMVPVQRICFDPHFSVLIFAKNTIRSQGALLWNSIPDNIKNSPLSYVFKKKYKDYLINLYNWFLYLNLYIYVYI